jgi:hypothetical protein
MQPFLYGREENNQENIEEDNLWVGIWNQAVQNTVTCKPVNM